MFFCSAGNLSLQKSVDEGNLYLRREQELKQERVLAQRVKGCSLGDLDSSIVQLQARILFESARGAELACLLESTSSDTRYKRKKFWQVD